MLVNLSESDALHTLPALYINHCVAELKRDIKIIKALHNITLQAS